MKRRCSIEFSRSNKCSAPSHLIRKLTLPPGSYITNSFDSNARELETTLYTSANTELNDHAYVYNAVNQRTKQKSLPRLPRFTFHVETTDVLRTSVDKKRSSTDNRSLFDITNQNLLQPRPDGRPSRPFRRLGRFG
jgi:hypothetical protein